MYQFIINIYYKYWKKWGWFGDYPTWEAAQKDCGSYDTAPIFERILTAARKVRDNEATYERDGVLFFEQNEQENLINAFKKSAGY